MHILNTSKGLFMTLRHTFICFIVASSLATPAFADSAQSDAGKACRNDAKKVCQRAYAAKDREAVKTCLMANIDKLSKDCRAMIEKNQNQAGAKNKNILN